MGRHPVRAKKHLGQHFLKDQSIAWDIVELLSLHQNYDKVLEIGPGTGVLTTKLLTKEEYELFTVEIDRESIKFLKEEGILDEEHIIQKSVLDLRFEDYFDKPFAIIGNLPYNISSPIFFKILENRDMIPEMVCMLQKEVAQRIASPPKKKAYGILSVFLQAFYDIDYGFTVGSEAFIPPPKVESGVIRLRRNNRKELACDEKFFFKVVKQSFSQRRKTLRNSLKIFNLPEEVRQMNVFSLRAEQLSVDEFVDLTNLIEKERDKG
jgi:16S rRNA (adenine1518-N6/adenine1519-N6)-dimethyltransferase